jgi:rod shape-determining protein MreB and related proteins
VTDVAVDLGTANTLIHVRGQGVVLDEPSVIAVERGTRRVLAVGLEAHRMLGRTPEGIVSSRPMRDGVIADVDMVDAMLREFLGRVVPRGPFRSRPRLVVGVPSGITEMERRAVRAAVSGAKVKEVYLISEPLAAAIGVDLPVTSASGSMVVNIGGGTSEIGVIALSGIVANDSIKVAGNELDEAIAAFIRKTYNLLIGDSTAEAIKMEIGSAYPLEEEMSMAVSGRDLVSGIPKTIEVGSPEIREAIQEPIRAILAAVRRTLEATPPELSADMIDTGIILTGGGSRLRGMDRLLEDETGLPIHRDPDPLTCVVRGAGKVLDEWEKYRGVLTK